MPAAPLTRLGADELGRALRAGLMRLARERELLDRINVFPVPDGDTGTNLALTTGGVVTLLKGAADAHAGQLLARVADAALDGARGNSGALLAQFLLGFADQVAVHEVLDAAEFAAAAQAGARYAREALAEPREGTILSVLAEFGAELGRASAAGVTDLRALLARGGAAAHRALERTRTQLDELARAGVVDAGAAGFVALIDGFADYLERGVLDESAPTALEGSQPDVAGAEGTLEQRWCTECMLEGASIDRRRLRERLAAVGSSLVVAGSASKVRVHVHASEPAQVFAIAGEFGAVSAQKADDMQRQQESARHATRRRVAIATDSAADIPEEELERLDIHVVPVRVHFGEHSYLDRVGLTPEEFYRLLASSPVHPKTSQPPAGDFRRLFEFLSSHYAEVVSINLTGRVSGTRQAAQGAAARTAAAARISVVDSGNAAGGEGLLAIHAAECAAAGLGAAAIIARLEELKPRTRTYAYLPTLDAAVRGGRVRAWVRQVARLLRLTPYLTTTPDGRIALGGFLAGRSGLKQRFADLVSRRVLAARRYRMIVSHANAAADGRWLLEALSARHPNIERTWLATLAPAVGVHCGPGALAVSLQESPASGFELPRGA
jgi:DegV family protein with EDD domain